VPSFWAIDRFENDEWAVVESDDGLSARLPIAWLPSASSEGHVLRVELGARDGLARDPRSQTVRFELDETETERRRERAKATRRNLPRGPQGDFEL
jgi:hypothetical protein